MLAVLLVAFVHKGSVSHVPVLGDDELPSIARVRDLIVEDWVEDPKERRDRLKYGAIEGMAAQLDPYSEFIPPEKRDRFEEDTSGQFAGLGVQIQIEKGVVVIIVPYEDTPAWRAGILPGDRILEIDGVKAEFASHDEATKRLRGPVDSTLELLVENPGRRPEPVRLTLKRAVIDVVSVKGTRILEGTGGIGYFAVTGFHEATLREFDRALAQLTSNGLTALVMDLRGNPGGFLNKATDMASRILEPGATVVVTRSRGGKNETKTLAELDPAAPKIRVPVAVLIDGGSASASEVLAGALRDNGKATLVGSRSFGKGSVQSLFPIEPDAEHPHGKAKLKLTTHYYCTPSGRRIHRKEGATEKDEWGLLPDLVVPLEAAAYQQLVRQEYELEVYAIKRRRDPGATFEAPDPAKLLRDPVRDAAVAHLRKVLSHEEKLAEAPRGPGGG